MGFAGNEKVAKSDKLTLLAKALPFSETLTFPVEISKTNKGIAK